MGVRRSPLQRNSKTTTAGVLILWISQGEVKACHNAVVIYAVGLGQNTRSMPSSHIS